MKIHLFAGAVICAFFFNPSVLGQGLLTPPGAPAPTMKTLDQVEPRIAISSLPYTISSSGSYYLTNSLTAAASTDAIIVSADNVTIDLRGYTLSGTGMTGFGINAPAAQTNVVVENGIIRNFAGGVQLNAVTGGRIERLTISDCAGSVPAGNAALRSGSGFIVRDCVVNNFNGGGAGFNACFVLGFSNVVSNCIAKNGTGTAQGFLTTAGFETLLNCAAIGNFGDGFNVSSGASLTNCIGNQNGGAGIHVGADASLNNCTAESNSGDGYVTSARCSLSNCSARSNLGVSGIATGTGCTLSHCTSGGNFNGTSASQGINVGSGSILIGCTADSNTTTAGAVTANTAVGIKTNSECVLRDCASQGNQGDGIQVGNHCQITGTTSNNNGTATTMTGSGIAGGTDCSIASTVTQANKNTGILAGNRSNITNCTATGNGSGGTGSGMSVGIRSAVKHCVVEDNILHGIIMADEGAAIENQASNNGLGGGAGDGIRFGNGSLVLGNHVTTNTGDGLHSTGAVGFSRIDGNLAYNNTGWGIHAISADYIVRNTANSNTGAVSGTSTANYNPKTGTNMGQIQTGAATTSPSANLE